MQGFSLPRWGSESEGTRLEGGRPMRRLLKNLDMRWRIKAGGSRDVEKLMDVKCWGKIDNKS